MDGAFQSEASRAQERATTLPQVAEGEISMFLPLVRISSFSHFHLRRFMATSAESELSLALELRNVRNMNNQSGKVSKWYRFLSGSRLEVSKSGLCGGVCLRKLNL